MSLTASKLASPAAVIDDFLLILKPPRATCGEYVACGALFDAENLTNILKRARKLLLLTEIEYSEDSRALQSL